MNNFNWIENNLKYKNYTFMIEKNKSTKLTKEMEPLPTGYRCQIFRDNVYCACMKNTSSIQEMKLSVEEFCKEI